MVIKIMNVGGWAKGRPSERTSTFRFLNIPEHTGFRCGVLNETLLGFSRYI